MKLAPAKAKLLRSIGLGHMVDAVEAGLCPICKKDMKDPTFRDELSLKEFNISGMCQTCQDKNFAEVG